MSSMALMTAFVRKYAAPKNLTPDHLFLSLSATFAHSVLNQPLDIISP